LEGERAAAAERVERWYGAERSTRSLAIVCSGSLGGDGEGGEPLDAVSGKGWVETLEWWACGKGKESEVAVMCGGPGLRYGSFLGWGVKWRRWPVRGDRSGAVHLAPR
jgi:hypothetical protein